MTRAIRPHWWLLVAATLSLTALAPLRAQRPVRSPS